MPRANRDRPDRPQWDDVEANRARLQADARKLRVVIALAVVVWIPIILAFWSFG